MTHKYKVGQKVQYTAGVWAYYGNVTNSMTTGEIEEIITEPEPAGATWNVVDASKGEPRYLIRNDNTGKSTPYKEANIVMDPTQLTALPSSDTAPGTWRRKAPRRDNLPKGAGRHQSTHSVFDWKSAVMPGTEPKYLRRSVDVDEALELAAGPFGFDIEWKPTFVKGQAQSPIAVLQLAKEDQILLIQLSAMHEFPQRLQAVLEDARIIKAGVGIMDDAKKLWREYGVSLLGAVELSHLARAVDGPRWTTGKARELISLWKLDPPDGNLSVSASAQGKSKNEQLGAASNYPPDKL
ncbi:3'-5' exonuclease [Ceratobasidium sp. AG-Ba]|nr:3'-5' exonuclease [Ceratobasidium sp. AG-Ba]QRW14913.1 ribonuclease H-like protein [Ceratobasidium sp. AG-Ba]